MSINKLTYKLTHKHMLCPYLKHALGLGHFSLNLRPSRNEWICCNRGCSTVLNNTGQPTGSQQAAQVLCPFSYSVVFPTLIVNMLHLLTAESPLEVTSQWPKTKRTSHDLKVETVCFRRFYLSGNTLKDSLVPLKRIPFLKGPSRLF